jgi:riboflavin synthase
MFTGLVQQVGRLRSVERAGAGAQIVVEATLAGELEPGDSVLVNGVCLTATTARDTSFGADLSPETLRRTSLGELEAGDAVNLELPLRLQDRLGGHLVQGHVDAVAEVRSVSGNGASSDLRLAAPPDVLRYVVEKGSVTLDGVSLTVTDVNESGFGVSLIPETLQRTNFGGTTPGRMVNLEVDVLAKYVEKLMERSNTND